MVDQKSDMLRNCELLF